MSFIHSSTFAYVKNLIIGLGASIVLIGALFKIQSWPFASEMLTVGLLTEAGLFLMLGFLPPHKDYYWEQLYPGLDKHGADIAITDGGVESASGPSAADQSAALLEAMNGMKTAVSPLENQQSQMVSELQTMSKTMKSLDIFAGLDFNEVGKLTKDSGKFVTILNNAIQNVADSAEDVKVYKEELTKLNGNLNTLNSMYGGVVSAMETTKTVAESTEGIAEDMKVYKERISEMNSSLASINKVYGGMLAAMKG
jgi:prefoldin subunit 5